jgi:hypothetical protein
VRTRILASLAVATALILASASSAAAQNRLGAGLSFLHAEGETATGVTVDYSGALQGAIGWVVDGSLHHNGEEGFSSTITMAQGGVRYNIPVTDAKIRPAVQALIGVAHEGVSDCDVCGSTNLVITPGGLVDIPVGSGKTAIRVAIDFPIIMFEGSSTTFTRFWFGGSWTIGATP